MTTGIYSLTFGGAGQYIGKSINIEKRMGEHLNSFLKGTAAKKLQEAFRVYGEPHVDILLECHADHIDLMESVYIIRNQPILNTATPIKLAEAEIEILLYYIHSLNVSTATHIKELDMYYQDNKNLTITVAQLRDEISNLVNKRTKEEINTEMGGRYHLVKHDIATLKSMMDEKERKLAEYEAHFNKPWWRRIL